MIRENFEKACCQIIGKERQQFGIGTLKEKTLHAILKFAYEPNTENHEIKVGSFYADIKKDDEIIEIQTRNFDILRPKLDYYFSMNYKVTILYPIPFSKHLIWIDNQTGELSKRRKSPKKGKVFDAFFELYKIKKYLTYKNIKFKLILMDVVEYRNLDGWSKDKKKGSSRFERIPERITEICCIDNQRDYTKLIPLGLPEEFTSADFRNSSGLSLHNSRITLNVLHHVNAVKKIGKQGNSILYRIHSTES